MKINHDNIVITKDEPFANDQLDRGQYAEIYTNIVQTYTNGFVLSLNGAWGTGKTTFIKMWQQHLENNEFKTIYFNAWENDFESNPLVAIIAELGKITKGKSSDTYKSLVKKGAILSKSILPALIKALAAKYIDAEVIAEALGNVTEGITEIFKDEVEEYDKKKKGLLDFRKELEKYVQENTNKKPLVLFIDELDRCRPDYAVELLEKVKHLFSVPGIVFVLSIDKTQLENAVKGVYGSEHIDSKEYLRRFIDLEFALPISNDNKYCTYLYKYFDYDSFFKNKNRIKSQELKNDGDTFLATAKILFSTPPIALRQQEKIMAHARLALNSFEVNQYVIPHLFLFLLFAKDFFPKFYNQLKLRNVPPQDIIDEFKKIIPNLKSDDDHHSLFLYLEVYLIVLYNNYYAETSYRSTIVDDSDYNNPVLKIRSALDDSENGGRFLSVYKDVKRHINSAKLSFILNKIDLLDKILEPSVD